MTEHHTQAEPFDWNEMWASAAGDCHTPDELVLQTIDELDLNKGAHVLDVGCGAGSLLRALHQRGLRLSGIDVASNAIALARKALDEVGATADLYVGDAAVWTPDSAYDLVTNCFALPGRFEDQQRAIGMMQSAVAPGGILVIKDFDSQMARFDHFAGFHMPTLEELTAPLTDLEILRAEIVSTPTHNASSADVDEDWTAAFIVARRR